MCARLWEVVIEYEDPFEGDSNSVDDGKVSRAYNAMRYLPRGKRPVMKQSLEW